VVARPKAAAQRRTWLAMGGGRSESAARCSEAGSARLGGFSGFSFESSIGKGKFWVHNPFAVHDANDGMPLVFRSRLLEIVLGL
jgi:hypothetical protein